MKHIYNGEFTKTQVDYEIQNLHAKVHWLLIYKEENYPILDSYFEQVLRYISSLNKLLYEPKSIISLMTILQEAREEHRKGIECDFKVYRKFILDSHSKIDALKEE